MPAAWSPTRRSCRRPGPATRKPTRKGCGCTSRGCAARSSRTPASPSTSRPSAVSDIASAPRSTTPRGKNRWHWQDERAHSGPRPAGLRPLLPAPHALGHGCEREVGPMSRSVCRKCWTWHGSGATLFPRCGAPLVSGTATEPAASFASQPAQPDPTLTPATDTRRSTSAGAARWGMGAIAAVAMVLGVVAILLILQWSARAESADGTFSVQTPSGWVRYTGTDLPDGPPTKNDLMVLLGPTADGVQAHLFIYRRQAGFADLGELDRTWTAGLDQATCRFSGAVGHFSQMTPTTIADSAALVTECRTPAVSVEFITVNHGNHTDMIGFTAASSQFDRLHDTSLQALLDSWRWN